MRWVCNDKYLCHDLIRIYFFCFIVAQSFLCRHFLAPANPSSLIRSLILAYYDYSIIYLERHHASSNEALYTYFYYRTRPKFPKYPLLTDKLTKRKMLM